MHQGLPYFIQSFFHSIHPNLSDLYERIDSLYEVPIREKQCALNYHYVNIHIYALIGVTNMWSIFGQAIVIHNTGVTSEPFCNNFQEATLRAVLAQLQCLTN